MTDGPNKMMEGANMAARKRKEAGWEDRCWLDQPMQIEGSALTLENYRQSDGCSCGFVAALTVVRYLNREASPEDVLRAVRPSVDWGVDRHKLRRGLSKLGVKVEYRKDLILGDLREYVHYGIPVIISVWPEDWYSDHWTVVQGFADDMVYLTNHWELRVKDLAQEWSDMDMRGQGGSQEGLVCLGYDRSLEKLAG